tara:strand:- start:274 stop:477 length:204 start_codon:yes stop_codon:yes gene_type:complete
MVYPKITRTGIMTKMGQYLMFGALCCLALVCVFVGSTLGAIAFITLGVLLELAFWIGIFKSSRKFLS